MSEMQSSRLWDRRCLANLHPELSQKSCDQSQSEPHSCPNIAFFLNLEVIGEKLISCSLRGTGFSHCKGTSVRLKLCSSSKRIFFPPFIND